MPDRAVKIPGPDHPITIEPNTHRIVVRLGNKAIADTTRALTLHEAHYPAVHYIPRSDVDMSLLEQHRADNVLSVQGRRRLLQHPERRRAIRQRDLDLRGAVRCRRQDQGPSGLLPGPHRRDRGAISNHRPGGADAARLAARYPPPPSSASIRRRAVLFHGKWGGDNEARGRVRHRRPRRDRIHRSARRRTPARPLWHRRPTLLGDLRPKPGEAGSGA